MGSAFDGIQRQAFGVVNANFGYEASWGNLTGKGLLREPTKKDEINGVEFTPFHRLFEYFHTDFPGLADAVRNGANLEEITVDGREFYCKDVIAKFDGKTIVIIVEEK